MERIRKQKEWLQRISIDSGRSKNSSFIGAEHFKKQSNV